MLWFVIDFRGENIVFLLFGGVFLLVFGKYGFFAYFCSLSAEFARPLARMAESVDALDSKSSVP